MGNTHNVTKKGKTAGVQPAAPKSLNLVSKSTKADELFNSMSEYNILNKNYQGKIDHPISKLMVD